MLIPPSSRRHSHVFGSHLESRERYCTYNLSLAHAIQISASLAIAQKIPYQHLPQSPRLLMINELHCTAELNIHITVDANETAFVFGLAPFETDNDFFVDPV